jgi:hypothetical protein
MLILNYPYIRRIGLRAKLHEPIVAFVPDECFRPGAARRSAVSVNMIDAITHIVVRTKQFCRFIIEGVEIEPSGGGVPIRVKCRPIFKRAPAAFPDQAEPLQHGERIGVASAGFQVSVEEQPTPPIWQTVVENAKISFEGSWLRHKQFRAQREMEWGN